jgi:hypothetical protein
LKQFIERDVARDNGGVQRVLGKESSAIRQRRRCVLKIIEIVACETPRLVPAKRGMQRSMDVQRAKLLPNLRLFL